MGEIRIKSGNLVQSVTSYPATGIYIGSLYVEADLKPDTRYTFAFKLTEGYEVNWNSNLFTTASPIIVGKGDEIIIVTKTTKSVVSKDNINQYNSNYGGWSITKNNKTEETTGVYTEVQLLEGTYTSETIPEYQPYFLNRPAHQVVNGQWVDIPTHHYVNGRWQGELTSQSPLKFRADGEMLDWRIEGKTSENLFDTSVYNNTIGSIRCTVTSTLNSITIEATGRDPYVGAYLPEGASISVNFRSLYIPVKPNTSYTLNMSSAPKCYWLKVDENNISRGGGEINALPFSFATDEFTKYVTIRFGNGNLQEGDSFTFENIQLLEGTYTASTIPPYEPYGGVGDYDETEQKYRIPVRVEGENLFDGELEQGSLGTSAGQEYPTTTRVRIKKPGIDLQPGTYTIDCVGATGGVVVYVYNKDSSWDKEQSSKNWQSLPLTFSLSSERLVRFAFRKTGDSNILPSEITDIQLLEGAYTASTLPPYEVSIYTDHQLMDGDSIDYTTDQTQIPIATGNNTLSVDTAVQPSKVFVKFEG